MAALLPRQLLYASFLPEATQAARGRVHPAARAWWTALEAVSWEVGACVRIDDAGPVFCIDVR